MKNLILGIVVIIGLSLFSCTNYEVKKDAKRFAQLFCRQSKIFSEASNLNDSTIKKELQSIERETDSINKLLLEKYENKPQAIETFAKVYKEEISKCN